jgi:DNA-binding response OmpR family regulator
MIEKKTILICDDEPDIVNLTERFLEKGNFTTITCSNGNEAMRILEEKHGEIALILLDIMMPGKSGFSVLQDIKGNELYKDIIVVLFTVKSFQEDIQKGKEYGADGYLMKPFSGKQLLQFVQDQLEKKNKKKE